VWLQLDRSIEALGCVHHDSAGGVDSHRPAGDDRGFIHDHDSHARDVEARDSQRRVDDRTGQRAGTKHDRATKRDGRVRAV